MAVQPLNAFASMDNFQAAGQMAQVLAASTLVPEAYRNNRANCVVALEIASRIGMSVFQVMQNLKPIKGQMAWSATYLIACVNSCGRFSPLRFQREEIGAKTVKYAYKVGSETKTAEVKINDFRVRAYAKSTADGETLYGPWVSLEMAVMEGWYATNPKYKSMGDVMLNYRAASFFSRIYASDITMGMHTIEEVSESIEIQPAPAKAAPEANAPKTSAGAAIKAAKNAKIEEVEFETVAEPTNADMEPDSDTGQFSDDPSDAPDII